MVNLYTDCLGIYQKTLRGIVDANAIESLVVFIPLSYSSVSELRLAHEIYQLISPKFPCSFIVKRYTWNL